MEMEVNKLIEFIKNYVESNKLGGIIIGISGGKDSAVSAALCVKALGKENVLGVTLPCESKNEDRSDAKLISDHYGFRLINFDLNDSYQAWKNSLKDLGEFTKENTLNSDINLKPRLRMSALYYLAALYSDLEKKTYIVAGNGNKSEIHVGYFTKGGDSVSDIQILSSFTSEEVVQIGEILNVPKEVLYKVPSDGLSNQTDEEKLGVSYKDINRILNNDPTVSDEIKEKVAKLHRNNKHKLISNNYERN